MLAGRSPAAAIADKACDNNALRDLIGKDGAAAVIPSLGSRKVAIPHDTAAYKLRNRIERFFNKIKYFRRIATCYEKQAANYFTTLKLVLTRLRLRHCVSMT